MQAGVFAKTFAAAGAMESLLAVKAAGFMAAQFNMACIGMPSMPHEISAEAARQISTASRETGISISAVSATYNMIHPDTSVREDGMRRLGIIIAAARDMGTRLVTLCTGTRDADDPWRHHPANQDLDAWRDLLTEMEKAAALAEAHGIDLGVEPELANVVNSSAAARRLIDELGSARIRIVLDPANLFETAEPEIRRSLVAEAAGLLGSRISMAHAKDRDAAGAFAAAGTGVIDFPHFVKCLKSAGFDGPLVAHGMSEAQAPSVAAYLRQVISE